MMDMIFTVGIFTSLFFFILLLNKKKKYLPDKILALWMLIIGIHLASTFLYFKGYWENYPHLIGITAPLPLIYGPFLYYYTAYSIKGSRQISRQDYLHLLPFMLAYMYMCRFYFFYTAEEKSLVHRGMIDDFGTFTSFLILTIIISAIAYVIYSYRLLSKHKRLIENNYSNTDRINLNWLKSFIWGIAAIFITVSFVIVSRDVIGISYPFNPDLIFYSMIVFAILALGYFGIRHENIFVDNVILETEEKLKATYKNSGLSDNIARAKHKDLLELMVKQKPYLEPDLTLNSLAIRLDISLHHLSQIINQYEGQHFNDFVNKYRVEEFIILASRDQRYSYLALALESGFNSKSTFNTVFKKFKGVTPSKFMSSHLLNTS